jgi:hypothetical protein
MKKLFAVMLAALFVLPIVLASHYQSYGNYDYSYNKDFEYVRYHENEQASRSYDSCNYYDLGYYGYTCDNYGSNYNYHRSRDFEFGRYHEDVYASGDYNRGYYGGNYDYYRYPAYDYDYHGSDYYGGRYGMGAYLYGYAPYG